MPYAAHALSGLAQNAVVVGAALFAVPATVIVHQRGRRLSLAAGYFVAAVGAFVVVIAALSNSIPLLFVGFFLFKRRRVKRFLLLPPSLRARNLLELVVDERKETTHGPSSPCRALASNEPKPD